MEHQYLPGTKQKAKSTLTYHRKLSDSSQKLILFSVSKSPVATKAGISIWHKCKQVQVLASQATKQSTSVGDIFRKAGFNASTDLGTGERWTLTQQLNFCMWKTILEQHPGIYWQQITGYTLTHERYLSPSRILSQSVVLSKEFK